MCVCRAAVTDAAFRRDSVFSDDSGRRHKASRAPTLFITTHIKEGMWGLKCVNVVVHML